MNVLVLSEQIYPHSSGAEVATYLYAKLLSDSQFNVKLVTNRFPGESAYSLDGHLSIYRVPLYQKTGTVKYQVLRRFEVLFSSFLDKMLKWADVVYIPRFWFSAIPLAKAYRKPVITHLHDYIPICPYTTLFDSSKGVPCDGNRLVCSPKCAYSYEKTTTHRSTAEMLASVTLNSTCGPLFSGLIGLSDALVCVSNAQKNIIAQSGYFSSQKLTVVHNPFFGSAGLPLEGDDFGYFGGLDRAKGFQVLYQAATCLAASANRPLRIHCTKIADIKAENARALQKSNLVTYSTLDKKLYEEVYKKICAVIVPSIWFETWSYIVVEALLNGRYVIASRIGGIPEVVDTCRGVSLVEPGNSDELKDAINNVLNMDSGSLLELGRQNRAAFKKRFSNQDSLNQFVHVIENVTYR